MKAQSYGVANFEEASAEVDYHYSKAENNGDPVKRPNLWKQGKKKVEYRTNHENKAHPYEAWGPQELADRINSCPSAEDLGVL